MTDRESERRRYPRVKGRIAVEIRSAQSPTASRATTEEISQSGCYVETMFTLDVGTKVSLTFWLKEERIEATALVATRYPQVGNGFDFVNMSADDRLKLNNFILECERNNAAAEEGSS
jgi:c-di-GMP-binding flagellar brake protein YcgR